MEPYSQPPGENKLRIIQELVPGRQVTLAHVIANPDPDVCRKLARTDAAAIIGGAVGILSVTPPEIAVIAADLAAKSASVRLEDLGYSSGTLFFSGKVAEVEAAMAGILEYLRREMDFAVCAVTKT